MKQYITAEQFNELPDEHKKKLTSWWAPSDFDLVNDNGNVTIYKEVNTKEATPLFSIGQLIAFLKQQHAELYIKLTDEFKDIAKELSGIYFYMPDNRDIELCDALWDAVKDALK